MVEEGERRESHRGHKMKHKMELVNQGNIEIYETKDEFTLYNKVERTKSQLERLTPEVPVVYNYQNDESCDSQHTSCDLSQTTYDDDLYKRIYELADTVQKEISDSSILDTVECNDHNVQQRDNEEDVSSKSKGKVMNEEDILMAAKIRKALSKMKRLDNKLAELSRREKEIKKQRKMMDNSDQESTIDDVRGERGRGIPVFSTQPQEKDDLYIECLEETDSYTTTSTETQTHSSIPHEDKIHSKKTITSQSDPNNFITRNKELAGQASQLIPMTEAERKHLESLLEEKEEQEREEDDSCGYSFAESDLNRLAAIDSELDSFLPDLNSDNTLITTSPCQEQQQQPGESVLLLLQEYRSEHARLNEIDKQLENLKRAENANDEKQDKEERELSYGPLNDAQIQFLIEQCKREQQVPITTEPIT